VNPKNNGLDRDQYLKLSGVQDWQTLLDSSLTFLRKSWEHHWLGLPALLDVCIETLIPLEWCDEPRIAALIHCARLVAQETERLAPLSKEPNYHNRLHFADALTAMTILLAMERERSEHLDAYWASLLLLTVTAHDYLHPGGNNQNKFEIENKTIAALQEVWRTAVIDPESQSRVEYMIQHTDPQTTAHNHELASQHPFELNLHWSTVLMNEADILASCTQHHGSQLGFQLAQEWRAKDVDLHNFIATPQGRINFLRSALFTSAPSEILKINLAIEEEITCLQCQVQSLSS